MNATNDFDKFFFKLMNNAVFGKTMENVRKYKYIKLVRTDIRRNKLVSETNYHTTKWFSESLLAIEMRKTVVKMNNPIYLGLSILALSKIKMYEYCYDDMKPKYDDRVKLCYMDTDSFIMNINKEDFYKVIANEAEKKYDTSNYVCERALPISRNKKVIGLMKYELEGKIMKEFIGLRPKCYATLMDDDEINKKAKGVKKCVIKKCAMFDNYEECLEEKKKLLRSQQRFKSDGHNVYTEESNKVAYLLMMIKD